MIIQFCGLSGSGKTTLANKVRIKLEQQHLNVEILDGDEYRKYICSDLGFSKEDRNTNIRRLCFIANKLSKYNVISIICAINPYDVIRKEIKNIYSNVKTIYISCNIDELINRDTKGFYKMAVLPENHPRKMRNLSGINDPFEIPNEADLVINTDKETVAQSTDKLFRFILSNTIGLV